MADRRDFLKLFGAGAAIVPIIGGLPKMEAEAKLVQVPTIELPDAPVDLGKPYNGFWPSSGVCDVTLTIRTGDGTRYVAHGKSLILEMTNELPEPIYSWGHHDPVGYASPRQRLKWQVNGEYLFDGSKLADTMRYYPAPR